MHRRAKRFVRRLFVTTAILGLAQPALAGGLSCSIGEVVIENLKIGQRYSLKTLANLPLSLTNTSDYAVRVLIESVIPDSSELRHGAEAIPALSWASATPETLALEPEETATAELTLEIPDDESLFGRKFQAIFWSHTLPRPGELLAYGLKSRVIFTIDRSREDEGVHPAGDLSLALLPAQIELEGIARGRTYRLEESVRQPLTIRNTSAQLVRVELRALSLQDAGVRPEEGCADLLGDGAVALSPSSFSLKPGEARTVEGTVFVAKQSQPLAAKDFMCIIAAGVTDQAVKTQIYSRVLVHAQ
jgi:hypothetical protein